MSAREVHDRAALLEEIGYSSLWTGDQVFRGTEPDDPLGTLLIAASATERVELGTCIFQVPLRNPVELASRTQALADLSGHRFLLGVGAGSTAGDFEALGVDFASRFRALDDDVAIMRRMWLGEPYRGAALALEDGAPKGVKVLVGTWSSSRWLRRAAEDFDGWIASARSPRPNAASAPPPGHPPSSWHELESGITRFREFGGGRAVCSNIRAQLLPDGAPASDQPNLIASSSDIRSRLRRLEDLGFDDAIVHIDSWNEEEMRAIRNLWP